jgi:membrane fusion protein, copper/silver efflux system
MKKIPLIVAIVLIAVFSLIAVVVGISIGSFFHDTSDSKTELAEVIHNKNEKWTCSMHPQVQQDKPGKCPICFMDLIPLKTNTHSETANIAELHLTPAAQKLADIQTQPVERKFVYSNIQMTGKIEYNEPFLAYITARMPGRIDRLFVNYTGIPVKKGDHMAEYYSPELLVAQRELLLAVTNLKKSKDSYLGYGLTPEKLLQTVKKKLELWGLTKQNIKKIVDTGKVSKHIVLYAPVGGIVIEKFAVEGKYFKTGDRLFTIADLSSVWVILEAYESDLAKLKYGQKVEFTTVAYPGETFLGKISFIDPVLDPTTRTVNVRVDASNPNGKLKPGMFVRAIVKSAISANGKVVMDASLAGKWICPMHPEIIKDGFGKCDICEMDLVKAESLGYVADSPENVEAPLVIPVTAPLITGKRAVVYVKIKSKPGFFEGREVVLGPKAGNYYIVKKGLREGELVVVAGNFKIDSALQLLAKPSMMDTESSAFIRKNGVDAGSGEGIKTTVRFTAPSSFLKQLDILYTAYFRIQKALSKDDLKAALDAVETLKKMLGHISGGNKTQEEVLASKPLHARSGHKNGGTRSPRPEVGNHLSEWRGIKTEIAKITDNLLKAKDINHFRANFANLSASVYLMVKKFGSGNTIKIKKFHCPMAFNNKGAYWLQQSDDVENPYFGAAMYRCGEKVEEVTGR